ncbi:hypothetical protein ACA910_014257 [Epithemia clementina (nom. ined.)]
MDPVSTTIAKCGGKELRMEDVIVIDDDDDDDNDDDETRDNDKQLSGPMRESETSSQQNNHCDAIVQSFMEIANNHSENLALFYLNSHHFDLERAIACFLEEQKQSSSVVVATTLSVPLPQQQSASDENVGVHTNKKHNNYDNKESPRVVVVVDDHLPKEPGHEYNNGSGTTGTFPHGTSPQRQVTVSTCSTNNTSATTEQQQQSSQPPTRRLSLSSQWKTCYSETNNNHGTHPSFVGGNRYFVDPEFPPITQSLDGRKRIQPQEDGSRMSPSSNTNPNMDYYCNCGLPAAARQVQSDGPNYGRFYLCCGQPPPQRRQRRRPPSPKTQKHNTADEIKKGSNTSSSNVQQPLQQDKNTNNKIVRNPYSIKRKATEQATTSETLTIVSQEQPPVVLSKNPPKKCNFFCWDPDGSIGAAADGSGGYGSTSRFSLFSWQHFGMENGCCLYNRKSGVDPSQVQQGAVGNCWFLSALAVVAEKSYLIHQLLPHTQLNDRGCYQINLCLDGKWTPVIVDSNLPVVVQDGKEQRKEGSLLGEGRRRSVIHTKFRGRDGVQFDMCPDLVAFPAFCATPGLQLWPSLVEKAYAKAHGSYAQLSGGFIAEGLHDLTGAPFETIVFAGNLLDREELWARLLSFHEAGFLMGVATSKGGDGLVGGHAYSVLNVVEVPDKIIGEQLKVTDFFCNPSKRLKTYSTSKEEDIVTVAGKRTNVRLVRIRNPWGKREWKGAWSANSEQWTAALRKILGINSYAKGDGTFFMSYDDMLERFHHMDVGKTREGWVHTSTDACFLSQKDPMQVSDSVFRLVPSKRTCAFISLCQPKKRSNAGNRFWYVDPSFVIIRKKLVVSTVGNKSWDCEASAVVGVKRISSCEVFLDPDYEYYCVPFSCMANRKPSGETSPFRLCTYSASSVSVRSVRQQQHQEHRKHALTALHRELLRAEHKLLYPVTPRGLVACSHGHGCVYFLAINGEPDKYISLKLNLDIPNGLILAFGEMSGGTHDIPPRSQKVIAVITSDGKFSTATSLNFTYVCDSIHAINRSLHNHPPTTGLGDRMDLTMSGDLLAGSIDQARVSFRGGDTLDTYLWIPQIGQASS